MKNFGERFLEKMKNKKSTLRKATLRDKDGNPIKIKYQDRERAGTDDVHMIACEVINHMPHDIYLIEDERYIENPVKYLVRPKERIVIPHTRMIPWDEYNSPKIDIELIYGHIGEKRS